MTAVIRLGTQGWSYKDWVGPFYPAGTPPGRFLELYSRTYDCVELDTTFYGPPRPETVRAWDASTPDGFTFAAKLPKAITHDKRLLGAEPELVEFLTVMRLLGPKLGPLLVQLPPSFTAEERPALEAFLEILPEEFEYAVEFRHPSWLSEPATEALGRSGVAWAIIDLAFMPAAVRLTAPFTYVRWLGNRSDVRRLDRVQVDRSEDIAAWAVQLDRIARRLERIYGFMNNHYAGHSPASVNDLRSRLGMGARQPPSATQDRQLSLEAGP